MVKLMNVKSICVSVALKIRIGKCINDRQQQANNLLKERCPTQAEMMQPNPTTQPINAQKSPPPPMITIQPTRSPGLRGYITSTPKSVTFSKKQRFSRKNERASCIPRRKNGERPYLAPPLSRKSGLFLASFSSFFCRLLPIPTQFYDFFFDAVCVEEDEENGMGNSRSFTYHQHQRTIIIFYINNSYSSINHPPDEQ